MKLFQYLFHQVLNIKVLNIDIRYVSGHNTLVHLIMAQKNGSPIFWESLLQDPQKLPHKSFDDKDANNYEKNIFGLFWIMLHW